MRQKSDYEYVQDLMEFIEGYNVKAIYVDPSAASFKQEMARQGVKGVCDANNDVLTGIRFQSQLLSNGTFKICSCCTEAIKEYTMYMWDSKASEKGMDAPVKRWDHAQDATRYALMTHFFNKKGVGMTERDAEELEKLYRYR